MHQTISGTDFIFRIRLDLGFKCSQGINEYLWQIVHDLQESGELPQQDKKYSIYAKSGVGNFRFCIIHKSVPTKMELLSGFDEAVLNTKYKVRKLAGSKEKWYGLDNSSLIVETVPLIVGSGSHRNRICRLNEEEKPEASPRS